MSSISAWIATQVERSLSLYTKGQLDSSGFKDDGSNLRFASHTPQHTIVLNWRESDGENVATLTDFNTQIEAVLAKEALEELKNKYSGRPLNRDATINHYAQLLEYEIVVEYAVSAPKIHLYVKDFSIAWDKGKYKGAPQGKSIRKNANIRALMGKAFEVIKSKESRRTASSPDAYGFDVKSQINRVSGKHASQELLQSQVQTSFVNFSGVSSMKPPSPSKRGSSTSSALLGYLGPHAKATDNSLPVNKEHEAATFSLNHSADVIGGSQHAPNSTNEIPLVEEIQESASGSNPEPILSTQHDSSTILEHPSNAGGKSQIREANTRAASEGDVQRGQTPEPTENLAHGHAVERRLISSHQTSPKQKVLDTKSSSDGTSSSHTKIWHGMTGIRARDVRIPRNQAALFEQHTRQWVPPDNSSSVRGHVPPELLAQWNVIARQKIRLDQHQVPKNLYSRHAESHEPSPEINSPTPQTDAESDDEPVTSQWSESSPERVSRPRRELPADSSPVARGPAHKGNTLHVTRSENVQEDQLPKAVDSIPEGKTQQDGQPISGARKSRDVSMEDSPYENIRREDGERILEPDHDETSRDSGHGYQAESDAESEDSIMDTSVPCPYGASQQSNLTNQSEQGIISSGSSLPARLSITRGHVQVMETPVANLKRLRSARLGRDESGPEPLHPEQRSSQVAKSSSQSRIFNTYASIDDDAEGSQTTDIPRANNDEEPSKLGCVGPQPSNGNLSVQDAMPNSHAVAVFDSSTPKAHDSNAPIPMSTCESQDSSEPFPSHDEALSSMGRGEKQQDVALTQALPLDTPVENSQISPLKRPASDIGVEEPPSPKRHKFMQGQNTDGSITDLNRPASGVVSRRQDYIRHSAEYLEAQQVYEKFQNDYPRYAGDFLHFKKACAMLQALRVKGSLQRSFLWDDFLRKHLEEYPRYLEQCLSLETKSSTYEEYFLSHFSVPTYKKRSLTAEGIRVVAAQSVPASPPVAVVSPSRLRNEADTSFTASLVDKFSDFHTHSFGPATEGNQSDTGDDRMSIVVSSPTPNTAKNNPRISADDHHSKAEEPCPEDQAQQPTPEGPQVGIEEQHSETEEQASEAGEQLRMEMATQLSTPKDLQDDNGPVVAESEINSEEDESMNEMHETASIELGDEEPSPAPEAPVSNVESDARSEPQSPNENWFLSLRHLGRQLSDDPDTAFKRWARADQNVLSERKFRRNWARIPTDDKGIPQRPCHSKPPS
ncbi:hypothetical protein BDV28DRAFT_132016 [Aspergillus coremiiformis]|uniref:Telomere replication protein EST3 n=1 Tax=Aspergillus coremiiformis TaxID=138285 RepID=A0A5N6ZAT6_9EURO|nr:hypothetical protein BDV28DRAFT_132016 [Aspergillus coremiiformis]